MILTHCTLICFEKENVLCVAEQLEEKMKWVKNVERVAEIQRQIVWPAVAELELFFFIFIT
jgi:hypothetical protein